jgi:hypothetical protein
MARAELKGQPANEFISPAKYTDSSTASLRKCC